MSPNHCQIAPSALVFVLASGRGSCIRGITCRRKTPGSSADSTGGFARFEITAYVNIYRGAVTGGRRSLTALGVLGKNVDTAVRKLTLIEYVPAQEFHITRHC